MWHTAMVFLRKKVVVWLGANQTWSSQDLSLGLETSRDPFLEVLVSVLVLKLLSLGLGLG